MDSDTVKKHPKLLVSGVWCIADLKYEFSERKNTCPWILDSLKPIQLSHFDFDGYLSARKQFTTDEWIDLLIQSIGFNPEMFGRRSKLIQLVRLIPYCERNYNLIELGPKGTGKSHIYSEFSPHGILISGGEVTVPKLFVNNATGRIGLVGYWDVVAFDEFAGKRKRVEQALVDIMKNYMANKSFSRGIETLGAEASMVVITDPHIRLFYQARNLMELLETITKQKPDEDEVEVHLVTTEDDFKSPQQIEYLEKMQESCATVGIRFSWEFDESSTVNARHIITNHGWKILLNQGLDVFQPYEMNDTFAVSNRMQRYRPCKAFEVTYVRVDASSL